LRAFLSHSSSDKQLARRVFSYLRDQPIDVWFDRVELRPGDSLLAKIASGIETADYLLVLVTGNSVLSPWVQKEVAIALSREMNQQKPMVIPLLVSPCVLPAVLADKLYIPIRADQDDFAEIVPALFRDSFVLDIDLTDEYLVEERSLRAELYEFSRSKYGSLRVRLSNNNFTAQIKEIAAHAIKALENEKDPLRLPAMEQIRRGSNSFDIHLPLFWTVLADFLSRLVKAVFDSFDQNMDRVDYAAASVSNTVRMAMRALALNLAPAVFPLFARQSGYENIARWVSEAEIHESEELRDIVESIAGPGEKDFLTEVEAAGLPDKRVIGTRFYAPIRDREILQFYTEPSTEIVGSTWYKLCIPQIIARELLEIVYHEGKPLHELDYTIGLDRGDYVRLGLP
jgi:hypothetical protein